MRKLMRRAAAAIMAFVLAVTVTPAAQAANRDWLRNDSTGQCEWDQAQNWVQYCTVWSPSMEKHIPVHIQPAIRGGNAGLYLLDGMRALPDRSAWTTDVNAAEIFVDSNITLAMPAGGAGSFYSDWDGPATFNFNEPVKYRWETFLTQELPSYLETNFGVARNNNSIAGLSMGATAALSLAAKHPDQFRQAISWSGYLTMTMPGMQTLLRLALLDVGGFNILTMYGSTINPRRFENDPFWNMDGLKNADVYISAGPGIPGPADAGYPTGQKISGALLEWFSAYSTTLWETKARATGLHVTSDYPKTGLHNWMNWRDQMVRTKPRILDVMNAW
ncbi:alpha/beta hydrolase family protein [uncultured Corynebacterium sp.]|uniref:alpha/beta hydrolase n=1 Tax=uncultured Corynebacterium sp. TaxID=159447 RepID=UPI0026384A11|nr:alpha/beta hydrolase family protein [uncultured Corynebacterium sp.]